MVRSIGLPLVLHVFDRQVDRAGFSLLDPDIVARCAGPGQVPGSAATKTFSIGLSSIMRPSLRRPMVRCELCAVDAEKHQLGIIGPERQRAVLSVPMSRRRCPSAIGSL